MSEIGRPIREWEISEEPALAPQKQEPAPEKETNVPVESPEREPVTVPAQAWVRWPGVGLVPLHIDSMKGWIGTDAS